MKLNEVMLQCLCLARATDNRTMHSFMSPIPRLLSLCHLHADDVLPSVVLVGQLVGEEMLNPQASRTTPSILINHPY